MQSQMGVGTLQEQGDKPLEQEDRAQQKEDNLLVRWQGSRLEQGDRQAEEDNLQAVLGSWAEGMLGSLVLQLDNQVLELGSLPQVHQGIHLHVHQGIHLQVHQGIQRLELLQVHPGIHFQVHQGIQH